MSLDRYRFIHEAKNLREGFEPPLSGSEPLVIATTLTEELIVLETLQKFILLWYKLLS